MKQPRISNRARITPPSPIRKLAYLANKAKKAGIHVYHLNIGQPDIESPREFLDGLHRFNQRVIEYEPVAGK
jgi:aspartate aminotransferase